MWHSDSGDCWLKAGLSGKTSNDRVWGVVKSSSASNKRRDLEDDAQSHEREDYQDGATITDAVDKRAPPSPTTMTPMTRATTPPPTPSLSIPSGDSIPLNCPYPAQMTASVNESSQYKYHCGTAFSGKELFNKTVWMGSLQDCLNYCEVTENCVAATYGAAQKFCDLKSALGTSINDGRSDTVERISTGGPTNTTDFPSCPADDGKSVTFSNDSELTYHMQCGFDNEQAVIDLNESNPQSMSISDCMSKCESYEPSKKNKGCQAISWSMLNGQCYLLSSLKLKWTDSTLWGATKNKKSKKRSVAEEEGNARRHWREHLQVRRNQHHP